MKATGGGRPKVIERRLEEAEDAIARLIEEGRLVEAARTAFREIFRPLLELSAANVRNIDRLSEEMEQVSRNVNRLSEEASRVLESIDKLSGEVERVSRNVDRLSAELEMEMKIRRGSYGELKGAIVEIRLLDSLSDFCSEHGLRLYALVRERHRVDAMVRGRRLLALVQVAARGSRRDVEQLLEGAEIFRTRVRVEPHALVLFTAAEPPEEVVEFASKHGVMVEGDPWRVAERLAEIDRELGRGS